MINFCFVSTPHHLKVVGLFLKSRPDYEKFRIFSIMDGLQFSHDKVNLRVEKLSLTAYAVILWHIFLGKARVILPDHVWRFYLFSFFNYWLIEDGLRNIFYPNNYESFVRRVYFKRCNGKNSNCRGFIGTNTYFIPDALKTKPCLVFNKPKPRVINRNSVLIVLQPLFEDGRLSCNKAVKAYCELIVIVEEKFQINRSNFYFRPHPRSSKSFIDDLIHKIGFEIKLTYDEGFAYIATLFSSYVFEVEWEQLYFHGTGDNTDLLRDFGIIPKLEMYK